MFGSIVGISRGDVFLSGLLTVVILAALAGLWRPLLFSSVDPELAEARGVPVRLLGSVFLVIVAITVSVAIQIVGVLLVFALLVGPAATAMRLATRPAQAMTLAVLLALAYTWGGILLASISPWPVSFFIASLSLGVYLPVRFLARARSARGIASETIAVSAPRRPPQEAHHA